eukprot:3815805-Pyramimonas_sp.AAC.1
MNEATTPVAWRVRHLFRGGCAAPGPAGQIDYPIVGRKSSTRTPSTCITSQCSASFAGTGRQANRHRHRSRPGTRLPLRASLKFRAVVQNTQGLNWRLVSHRDKLTTLITTAREQNWDCAFLAEMHGEEPCR